MWSYYGSKNRIVKYYPKPVFNKIIEPFAGAAYYSLRYFENDVILIDKNPVIINIWNYLQQCSLKDITSLPILPAGEKLKRENFDCDGQFNLMRFLICQASYSGNNVVSKWGALRLSANIRRVAAHLFKIKHWNFIHGSYEDLENVNATWFIDPPYTFGGHKYLMSNKKIDFNNLSEYCLDRKGQVIVCENTKADWLPFVPLTKCYGVKHTTMEAIYTNMPTNLNNLQQSLFGS